MQSVQFPGIALLAAFLACGCASNPPDVRFTAEYLLPHEIVPVRADSARVAGETEAQLIARGFIRLGWLEVTAKRDATAALLQEAPRLGAEVVHLQEDNRSAIATREQCTDVRKPGAPAYCLQWDPETGICSHWSAPDYFECGKWASTTRTTGLVRSRASLWRREALATAILQDADAVRAALASGENPNAGWLPLAYAIDRPDIAILQALLAGGARPDVRALGYAARRGNAAAVQTLLAAGAPVNQAYVRPGGAYTTVLHDAVRSGHVRIAELLAARGADVNAIPWFGSPALNDAVTSGNEEIARILLMHGANANLKGQNGASAMEEAARLADPDRQRMLRILANGGRN